MANTYTQIHIQAVFAVQHRACVIANSWKEDLHKYITGIVQGQGHKLLAINAMLDHIHILFGMRPIQSISDLLQDIKADSSQWINEKGFIRERFSWQGGYGRFHMGYHRCRALSNISGARKNIIERKHSLKNI